MIALTNTLFLVYVDSRQARASPYIGILAWIVAPAILGFRLILLVLGMFLEHRRRQRLAPGDIAEYPLIDLNNRRARLVILGTIALFICFVTASVIGTYQAYHYTESNTFCGATCHQPMHPEYTAYQNSPHARVDCVSCHVGGGASWYVRSKINGVHQLTGDACCSLCRQDAGRRSHLQSKVCDAPRSGWSGTAPTGKSMKVRDLRSDDVQKMSDVDLMNVIADGKGKMPAYKAKLSSDEVQMGLAYIRQMKK